MTLILILLSSILQLQPTTPENYSIKDTSIKACMIGDCFNEHSYIVYEDGSIYYGELEGGEPNGQGLLKTNSFMYDGEFICSDFSGWGGYISGEYIYVGDFKYGEIIYGKIKHGVNDIYIGEFQGWLKHGNGKVLMDGEAVYIGEFFNDKYEGEGTLVDLDKMISHSGLFDNGKAHGEGELLSLDLNTDWEKYTGEFERGIPNGVGIIQYRDKTVYYGSIKNGEKHGRGALMKSNNNSYIGDFTDDEPDGFGTYFLSYSNEEDIAYYICGDFNENADSDLSVFLLINGQIAIKRRNSVKEKYETSLFKAIESFNPYLFIADNNDDLISTVLNDTLNGHIDILKHSSFLKETYNNRIRLNDGKCWGFDDNTIASELNFKWHLALEKHFEVSTTLDSNLEKVNLLFHHESFNIPGTANELSYVYIIDKSTGEVFLEAININKPNDIFINKVINALN